LSCSQKEHQHRLQAMGQSSYLLNCLLCAIILQPKSTHNAVPLNGVQVLMVMKLRLKV